MEEDRSLAAPGMSNGALELPMRTSSGQVEDLALRDLRLARYASRPNGPSHLHTRDHGDRSTASGRGAVRPTSHDPRLAAPALLVARVSRHRHPQTRLARKARSAPASDTRPNSGRPVLARRLEIASIRAAAIRPAPHCWYRTYAATHHRRGTHPRHDDCSLDHEGAPPVGASPLRWRAQDARRQGDRVTSSSTWVRCPSGSRVRGAWVSSCWLLTLALARA